MTIALVEFFAVIGVSGSAGLLFLVGIAFFDYLDDKFKQRVIKIIHQREELIKKKRRDKK